MRAISEEALAATQEAVDISRRLAQTRPDAFLPDLARSLNNLGNSLSGLGRREEALAATQEAVDIRRRLAQTRPDAFLPDLAISLNNLGSSPLRPRPPRGGAGRDARRPSTSEGASRKADPTPSSPISRGA